LGTKRKGKEGIEGVTTSFTKLVSREERFFGGKVGFSSVWDLTEKRGREERFVVPSGVQDQNKSGGKSST